MKLTQILLEATQESEFCKKFENKSFAEINTNLDNEYTLLGKGDNGYAYKTPEQTVIKLTRDQEELEISSIVRNTGKTTHFVEVYNVCNLGEFGVVEKQYAKVDKGLEATEDFFDAAEEEIGTEIDPDTKGNLGYVNGVLKFFDW